MPFALLVYSYFLFTVYFFSFLQMEQKSKMSLELQRKFKLCASLFPSNASIIIKTSIVVGNGSSLVKCPTKWPAIQISRPIDMPSTELKDLRSFIQRHLVGLFCPCLITFLRKRLDKEDDGTVELSRPNLDGWRRNHSRSKKLSIQYKSISILKMETSTVYSSPNRPKESQRCQSVFIHKTTTHACAILV